LKITIGGIDMAGRKAITAIALCALIFLIRMNPALADEKIIIVANQTALGMAKDFLTALNNESIPLSIVMDQFDKAKNEKHIIVLGGAKGAGSVEEFVKKVLTPEEQQSGNQPGGKLFIKESVFAPGQVIIVFTGPDEAAAADARKKSRNTWWQYIAKWYELDSSNPMIY
jgi:hypothetical protein